jgi:hypothetical protein
MLLDIRSKLQAADSVKSNILQGILVGKNLVKDAK